jgi:acetyl esterase/lipase
VARRRLAGMVQRLAVASATVAATIAVLALSGCSRLVTFNTIMPKDRHTVRVVQGAAFGAGPRRMLDVYAPAGMAGPRPVIIFLYGGSWQNGTRAGYGFVGRALAAKGFVVVIPDYRLMPEVRFPGFLDDNAAAVRWVRAHAGTLGGDPDRIVLAGHSAGAYDAAMLALDPRWLRGDRAAVRGFVGLAGPYDFLPLDDPVAIAAFGGWPDPAETQPITYASRDDPPAFIAYGVTDDRVRPANSKALAARLRGQGVAVEERGYSGIGHVGILTAFARPLRRQAPVLDDVAAFATRVTR